jgi:integrase
MRGTIRKLKNRKTTTWEVRVDLPLGADGRRRMKSVSVRGTKRDADMKLRTLLAGLDKDLSPESNKTTASGYFEWWLQSYVLPNVRERTSERYASDVRLHIGPVIGSIRLNNLRADDAQAVLSRMLDRDYSRSSVRHCYRVMRLAFKHAVEKGILLVNVTDAVRPPRLESTELVLSSLEEVRHVLKLAESTPYDSVLSFMIRTGCRRGEALGLEWRHVDLEHGRVAIVQSLQRIGRKGLHFVPPQVFQEPSGQSPWMQTLLSC